MDRLLRLRQFWSWLPDFRAVAEHQNLHAASRALHVSPSSISRTLRLLEASLRRELFLRSGRSLELNEAGRELLAAVRNAMREVDEALQRLAPGAAPEVRIGAPGGLLGRLASLVLSPPSAPSWRGAALVFKDVGARVELALLSGELDLAVVENELAAPELVLDPLGAASRAVYRAPHAEPGAFLSVRDGCAPGAVVGSGERIVRVECASAVAAACASGAGRAVLFDLEARPWVMSGQLIREPEPDVAPARLYLARRPTISGAEDYERVADLLRRAWLDLGGRVDGVLSVGL